MAAFISITPQRALAEVLPALLLSRTLTDITNKSNCIDHPFSNTQLPLPTVDIHYFISGATFYSLLVLTLGPCIESFNLFCSAGNCLSEPLFSG